MDRKYWEQIAPNYSEEIFDVLANDKKGIIRKTINRFASKQKTVIDIGCAIGKWLPLLSPAFKKVHAIDISAENLAIANNNLGEYENGLKYSNEALEISENAEVIEFAKGERCDQSW